jgi:hypothetical protein
VRKTAVECCYLGCLFLKIARDAAKRVENLKWMMNSTNFLSFLISIN